MRMPTSLSNHPILCTAASRGAAHAVFVSRLAPEVAEMLEDLGIENAADVTGRVIDTLRGSVAPDDPVADFKLLDAPVVICEQPDPPDAMAESAIQAKLEGNSLLANACETHAGAKDRAKGERERAKLAAAAENEAQALQVELERCRVRAARLRISNGAAPIGALEMGPFSLPNPGGGADLIENANLVLVPGHRYGLIGR